MSDPLFYHTIEKPAFAEFKDRGSRFLAYAYPIKSTAEVKENIQQLKKMHPKAVHFCFAYRCGFDGNNFRSGDDGEPAGTAGKPILGQLDSKGLVDALVVVVRYFGGTLLGTPGLINAYKSAAAMALQLTPLVQKQVMIRYQLQFDYTKMNDVMQVVRQFGCEVLHQETLLFCNMEIGVPKSRFTETLHKLKDMPAVQFSAVV